MVIILFSDKKSPAETSAELQSVEKTLKASPY